MPPTPCQKAMNEPILHIALFNPEIPQNTGNIGRLSLGIGARLHIIKPIGFSLSEKAVRRAGLDYWKHVDLQVHNNWEEFVDWAEDRQMILMSTKASKHINELAAKPNCILLFGPETKGLTGTLREQYGCYKIPMKNQIRSYNLSNSVAIASYFVLQSLKVEWGAQ